MREILLLLLFVICYCYCLLYFEWGKRERVIVCLFVCLFVVVVVVVFFFSLSNERYFVVVVISLLYFISNASHYSVTKMTTLTEGDELNKFKKMCCQSPNAYMYTQLVLLAVSQSDASGCSRMMRLFWELEQLVIAGSISFV
jgi:hypothetical protein